MEKKQDEYLVPGIGERVGYKPRGTPKAGISITGEVVKIEITAKGVWVTFRTGKLPYKPARRVRVLRSHLMGWTAHHKQVSIVTFND